MRWDAGLWATLGEGPYAALVAALGEEDPAVTSYARLAAEAVGRGTVFPPTSGAPSFTSRAFLELLPRWLPALGPRPRAEALAEVFNLGENLAASPGWVQRLLESRLARAETPEAMREVVRATGTRILATPEELLGERVALRWLSFAAIDPRFLPGPVCFLAPLVGLVRARHGDEAIAVWLGETPELLGPAAWPDAPERALPDDDQLEAWRAGDPRFTGVHDVAVNAHRAIATLETSQQLVVVCPATG